MRELVWPIKGGVSINKLESRYGSRTDNTSLTSSFVDENGTLDQPVGDVNRGNREVTTGNIRS